MSLSPKEINYQTEHIMSKIFQNAQMEGYYAQDMKPWNLPARFLSSGKAPFVGGWSATLNEIGFIRCRF